MIQVVIADDQQLIRAGFRMLLDDEPDIDVVAEASDGGEATALAQRLTPDVVLMDVRMPRMDGIEATRRIAATCPDDVHVLVVTTYEVDEAVFEALRAGANGFVLKDIAPDDLVRAVRVVAAGEALLAPSVTRRLVGEFASRPAVGQVDERRLSVLTDREREVAALVANGLDNGEIADQLVISPATARTHVSRAITKLGVRDRPTRRARLPNRPRGRRRHVTLPVTK